MLHWKKANLHNVTVVIYLRICFKSSSSYVLAVLLSIDTILADSGHSVASNPTLIQVKFSFTNLPLVPEHVEILYYPRESGTRRGLPLGRNQQLGPAQASLDAAVLLATCNMCGAALPKN